MNIKYKFINTKTNEVAIITDDLYAGIEELINDDSVEDFVNEITELPELPYLKGYRYGTLLRYLAENTSNHSFFEAWTAAKEDFLEVSYESVCDCFDWEEEVFFQNYKVILVMES